MWFDVLLVVGANQRRIGLERFEGVDDDLERLVVDLDLEHRVGGGVAVGGDDRGDFLSVVDDFFDRQYHLLIAHQRRHPGQPGGIEVLAGDDGHDAGHRQRFRGVDVQDLGVRVRAAHDVEVEHAGQVDVVDVVSFAPDEARIFLTLDAFAQTLNSGS